MSTSSGCRVADHRGCGFYIWPDRSSPAEPDFCECDCHALPADPLQAVMRVLEEDGFLADQTRMSVELLQERLAGIFAR